MQALRRGHDMLGEQLSILREASKQVPVVKFALALVGIAAALAIIRTFWPDVSLPAVFPLLGGMIALMAVVIILSAVVGRVTIDRGVRWIALALLWAICVVAIFLMAVFSSALAFGWPEHFAKNYLPGSAATRSISAAITNGEDIPPPPPDEDQAWLRIDELERYRGFGSPTPTCETVTHIGDLREFAAFFSFQREPLYSRRGGTDVDVVEIAAAGTCFQIVSDSPSSIDRPDIEWLRVEPMVCPATCEGKGENDNVYPAGADNEIIFGSQPRNDPNGYIYYAVEDGFPTEMSNLVPEFEERYPRIEALASGEILVATRDKNLRRLPTTRSAGKWYPEGSCFEVLESNPVYYLRQSASWSAGWLPVRHVTCRRPI